MASKSNGNKAFNLDTFVGDNKKYAGKRSDQGVIGMPPHYAPPAPEKTKGAATHSDNAYAKKLIDEGGQFFTKK